MGTTHLIFFSKEHLSAGTLFTQSFVHTMANEGKAVKPPLIGYEVIPESLRLHSTIPTQTAAKMAKYQKSQPKNAVSRTGAISFDIFNGDQKYMDKSLAFLHIKCQIRNGKSEMIPLKGYPPRGGGAAPFNPFGELPPGERDGVHSLHQCESGFEQCGDRLGIGTLPL